MWAAESLQKSLYLLENDKVFVVGGQNFQREKLEKRILGESILSCKLDTQVNAKGRVHIGSLSPINFNL